MNIFQIQNRCFLRFWSWSCRHFRTKRRNKFAYSKISSSMSAMLFALIFPRAERVSTFDISAERNVWLQLALRSFAIVCDYMETALFAIVCDRLRSYGNQPLNKLTKDWQTWTCNFERRFRQRHVVNLNSLLITREYNPVHRTFDNVNYISNPLFKRIIENLISHVNRTSTGKMPFDFLIFPIDRGLVKSASRCLL